MDKQKIFIYIFLLVIVLYTIYLILTKVSVFGLNSDTVNEILYRYVCWKEKTLFPTNFICSNESFASRPTILYGIIYTITQDFMGSFLIENCITFIALCSVVFYLFRFYIFDIKLRILGVCAFCLLIPTLVKQVIFFPMNAYVLFAIVILLTICLRAMILQSITGIKQLTDCKRYKWKIFFLFLLAATSGFVTIKLMMVLYAPLLLCDGINLLLEFIYKKSISLWRFIFFALSGLLCVINILFQLIFLQLYGNTVNPLNLQVASIQNWLDWNVISAQLQILIYNFGIEFSTNLNSVDGIRMLIGMGLFFINIIILLWYCKQMKSGTEVLYLDLFGYWLSTTLVILFFQVITATTIPVHRYYFASALVWSILTIVAFNQWREKHSQRVQKIATALLAILLMSVFSFDVYTNNKLYTEDNVPILKNVAQYIQENGYQYVTGTYWNSGVITGYTNGAVQAQHSSDLKDFTCFYWLTETTRLEDPRYGEKELIILTDEEENTAIAQNGVLAQILQSYAKKVKEIDVYNLYEVEENPLTLAQNIKDSNEISFPDQIGETEIIYPKNEKMVTQNGILLDNGEIISNGSQGYLLYGPYINTEPGVYDIKVYYTIDSLTNQMQEGTFDVAIDTIAYSNTPIRNGTNCATIYNVILEDGHIFESRVWVPDGMVLTVHSIEYTKIQ